MRASRAALAALLLGFGALACGPGGGGAPEILRDLPEPAAGDVAEAALAQFAAARAKVTEAAAADGDGRALAEAVGALGRLYLVHAYPEAALECFRRARDQDPAEPRWPYLAGYLHQQAGELDEAAAAFEHTLELETDNATALYRLGEVELDRNLPAAAAERFRRALEIDAGLAAAHFGLGRAALAQGEHRLAITHLEAALAEQPEATKIHHPLGLAYRGIRDLERAEYHLERRGQTDILLVDPWIAEVDALASAEGGHVRSGLAASRSGDRQRARQEFAAAVEEDPDDLIARHNLAVSLTRHGDPDGAAEQYREILARQPENAQAAFNLATLLAERGRYPEAVGLYQKAVTEAPDFKQARMNLGTALGRSGRWQEAVAEYDALMTLDPEFASVRSVRALALVEAGRADEGFTELRALVELDPTAVEERIALASILLRRGDRPGALAELDAGVEATVKPAERARLQRRAGMLMGMTGNLEEAISRLESARQLDPSFVEASISLGQLLLRAGRGQQAAVEFARAVELEPKAVAPRLAEVQALWSSGDCAGARQRLEAGRQAMPRSAQLAHALARLLATCPESGARDGERAVTLARELVAAQPTGAHSETLAMALAETGRYGEAAEVQARLLDQARGRAPAQILRRLEDNLGRYRRGEPVRLTGLNP